MKKEVILLVGPMGSGKSTYVKENLSNYFRISQDEQGKEEHFEIYLKALKRDEKYVVIDRINHVYYQRKKYLDLAREKGYSTKIIVMNLEFKNCYDRIIKREEHPNLGNKSEEKVILKALRSYFNEYQKPTNNESDELIFLNDYDPYMLDLSNKYKKYLIIGDVHGCYDELKELIEKSKITKNTAIIFVGDLFDKGIKNKEVLEYFKSLTNVYTISGNHEEKLKRYLRGNNVSISHGLDRTIENLNLDDINTKEARELLFELESLPFIIKISDNDFVVHGGINPLKSVETQSREHLMYMRTFNPITFAFSNENDTFWFEEYNEDKPNIYFGHNYHEKVQVRKNVFSLDGNCVFGNELRGIMLTSENKSFNREIISVKAKEEYYEKEIKTETLPTSPYERLVNDGYIRKSENENLVLYNYTEKCTYERYWNEYTLQARGLIFDKKTQELIARPFVKFFNLGENEESLLKNLPLNQKYEAYEKVDGSLGVVYYYNNKWNIATRGSLNSEQAIEGQKIIQKYNTKYLDKKFTYLVEIIYPENKIIVDYGDEKKLILLGCRNTKTGDEKNYCYLEDLSKKIGMEISKKYNYSIDEMIKLQKTLSKDEEGFVVKFENNLRVKIKGDQYLKLAKIVANISPISLWEVMEKGKVSEKYLAQIPEEILPDINPIKEKLELSFLNIEKEIEKEIEKLPFNLKDDLSDDSRKELALHIKEKKYEHSQVFFPIFNEQRKVVEKYIMKKIRPHSNKIIGV